MSRTLMILAFVAVVPSCSDKQNVQCASNGDCNLSGGGMCTLNASSGNSWCAYPDPLCPSGYRYSDVSVGDGLADECVAMAPVDAGVDAPDAPDGGTIVSGQYAELVIGQDDFTTNIANSGGQSASSLNGPTATASDGTHLWVADAKNARLVQFNALPVVNRPVANIVIGQAAFTTSTSGTSQTTIRIGDVNMFAVGGKLFVVDGSSNRVLIYSSIPTQNGAAASLVIGQGDFTSSTGGKAATSLNGPADVWSDGTRLVVSDNANSRVLIWTSIPTASGQAANIVLGRSGEAADAVLGQDNLSSSVLPNTPTGNSMSSPRWMSIVGNALYVPDYQWNRVTQFKLN